MLLAVETGVNLSAHFDMMYHLPSEVFKTGVITVYFPYSGVIEALKGW